MIHNKYARISFGLNNDLLAEVFDLNRNGLTHRRVDV